MKFLKSNQTVLCFALQTVQLLPICQWLLGCIQTLSEPVLTLHAALLLALLIVYYFSNYIFWKVLAKRRRSKVLSWARSVTLGLVRNHTFATGLTNFQCTLFGWTSAALTCWLVLPWPWQVSVWCWKSTVFWLSLVYWMMELKGLWFFIFRNVITQILFRICLISTGARRRYNLVD